MKRRFAAALCLMALWHVYAEPTSKGIAVESLRRELGGSVYGRSWALVIGIDHYPVGGAFRSLSFAGADARAVRDLLVNYYGFPAGNVVLLVDDEATRERILNTFIDLADKTEARDRLIFYFSGHGHTVDLPGQGKRGFLIPADAKLTDEELDRAARLERKAISMTRLRNIAQSVGAKHTLFLMDACYSGLAISGRSAARVPYHLKRLATRRVLSIITAGRAGDEALEIAELGHGCFTRKLLDGLTPVAGEVLADTQPPEHPDGIVTLKELADYLVNSVPAITRGRQSPLEGQEGEGQLLLFPVAATPLPPTAERPPPPPVDQRQPVHPVKPQTGRLNVFSDPPGAIVFIDGEPSAGTPLEYIVEMEGAEEREVEVRVELAGFQPHTQRVRVRAGESVRRDVALVPVPVRPRPEPPAPRRPKPPAPVASPGETRVNPIDGAEMVLLPGGEFIMGSDAGRLPGEKPAHRVRVSSFWIYRREVTNAQFCAFLNANLGLLRVEPDGEIFHKLDMIYDLTCTTCGAWTERIRREGTRFVVTAGFEQHPVTRVSWSGAQAYAAWAGMRLPTEAEWEYAARGGQGFEHGTSTGMLMHDLANYDGVGGRDTWEQTAPVGSFPPNPFGLFDMAGNVWEWCHSILKDYPYRADDGREADTGARRVYRGGAWNSRDTQCTATHRRAGMTGRVSEQVGFRCASNGEP